MKTKRNERERKIEKKEIKEKSWELYIECKGFLESNEKNWEKHRLEREQELKRKERLQVARYKQEKMKEKARERKLEKEISEGLNKLPEKERNNIAIEEEKKRKVDLAETRKNSWKLRTKRKGETSWGLAVPSSGQALACRALIWSSRFCMIGWFCRFGKAGLVL